MCKVEKFNCCGNVKKPWIHQDHVLSGDEDDTSLCVGEIREFETEVQGRCCTSACCRRQIEDSEDFKERKELERLLRFEPSGPKDERVDWKDRPWLRRFDQFMEYEFEKQTRVKLEARKGKWKLANVGVQKLKEAHEKRCKPLQNE